ncbi:MAG: hypothetical protein U1A77_07595 [Pirellulales bacterium]
MTLNDSPTQQQHTSQEQSETNIHSGANSHTLLPFAQLGLRLLGVMLIVDGVGAMFGGVIQGLLQARLYADAGYKASIDPHSAGWAAGGIPHLVAGIYLIIGGDWVLRNVFTSSHREAGELNHVGDEPDMERRDN